MRTCRHLAGVARGCDRRLDGRARIRRWAGDKPKIPFRPFLFGHCASIAQVWLHDTGHDTTKGFGTKTREWEMDTVII
jgi:hypothetical protein